MQLLGWQPWSVWGHVPQAPPPMAAPAGIAPATILDLVSSDHFWAWCADILSHRALYLQIGVALTLVCLVLGLLNICCIQAELLLGRRRMRPVDKQRDQQQASPAQPRLGGSDMGMNASLHYHKQWAELVEARVEWRFNKIENSLSRGNKLLGFLDRRVRRLEGREPAHGRGGASGPLYVGLSESRRNEKASPTASPGFWADRGYPLMKRPGSPRPGRGVREADSLPGVHAAEAADSASSGTTVESLSRPESAGAGGRRRRGRAAGRPVERRSSSLDLSQFRDSYRLTKESRRMSQTARMPWTPRGALDVEDEAQCHTLQGDGTDEGQALQLSSKDLQLKFERSPWPFRVKKQHSSSDDLVCGLDREHSVDISPRPASVPDAKGLADLHQTIDESQANIPVDVELAEVAAAPELTDSDDASADSKDPACGKAAFERNHQNVLERGRLKHHEQGVALEVALGADQPTARPRARGTPLNLGEAVAQAYGADLYIKSHDDSGYSGHSGCPASEASSRG